MGLVCIVVDANWNTGCSAQRVPVNWVRNGDCSSRCICVSISSSSFPSLQRVLPEESNRGFLEPVLPISSGQPYLLINGVSGLAVAAG